MSAVTVLMSVYNGMPHLPPAVDSILNQTFEDFTFLIINDGSKDGSERYLNQLDDPRIQLVHQLNRGLGAALNTGLAMCKTEFLARMDADDMSLPTRLEAQLSFLRSHSEVGMVGTQFSYFGAEGRRVFSPHMPCGHETIYTDLLHARLSFVHASLMCRTSVLRQISGYASKVSDGDWDMFLRAAEVTRLANLDEVLYLWRIHSGNISVGHLTELHKELAYGCDGAKRRAKGQPELCFDEFVARQHARPFWERAVEAMDHYALVQYRRALVEILNSNWITGYLRLVWAASFSPRRTLQRIYRTVRGRKKS